MSGVPDIHTNQLTGLKREARWAATTWHLIGIAGYSRTCRHSRQEASRFGWGKKARHSVEALTKIYFQYGQSTFLDTIMDHAPSLYEGHCLCECHHGVEGTYCDCCDNYGTSCFCHCHFCVNCDIEANNCFGEDECGCDCHRGDCCNDCQGACWCQCHNCLECNGQSGECGEGCGCDCHESCTDCSVRHFGSNEDEDEDSCGCDCHNCDYCDSDCYDCSCECHDCCGDCIECSCDCHDCNYCDSDCYDCSCECHDCCGDCIECYCDCHDCDYCDFDCYDCSCECHDCCEECKDQDDDTTSRYQPSVSKVERVSERIQQALGVQLSIKETDQIGGQRIQAAAYPDDTIKITHDLSSVMTDDELAFIIGHEYAHIEQKHIQKQLASRAAKRLALRQGLSDLDGQLRQKGSGKIKRAATHVLCGALGEASVALTGQLESQHYETNADERAMEVAAAAGYKPEASVTTYEKLHGGRVPEIGIIHSITSSHPAPKARHENLTRKSKNRRNME